MRMEIVKLEKPQLPMYWEYETSIKFVSETIFKWKNITADIANELWIARYFLSKEGRPKTGSKAPVLTWAEYCKKIGSSKGVVNKWLKQWFETVHVTNNSGEIEWYTPPNIIEAARQVMGTIDLDPATSIKANEIVRAEQIFTIEDDGINQSWNGNVWMNPPYGQPAINDFSDKLINELPNISQACVLVNNATETNWFQNMMKECDCICFLRGRIKYLDYTGAPVNTPLQGQAIMYFGNNSNIFYRIFNSLGICLKRIK